MTKIFITRHGQTKWNKEGRSQGHKNSDLTELGIEQAKWLGERLDTEDIDVIITSSLGRAVETAEHIRGKREIEIVLNDNLKEMHMGLWEGKLHHEVRENWPEESNNFRKNPHKYKPLSSAETFEELIDRVTNEIYKLAKSYKGKNILIVTHGVALKAIFAHIEEKELKNFWEGRTMDSTCLNILEFDGEKLIVKLQGDTSHYKG